MLVMNICQDNFFFFFLLCLKTPEYKTRPFQEKGGTQHPTPPNCTKMFLQFADFQVLKLLPRKVLRRDTVDKSFMLRNLAALHSSTWSRIPSMKDGLDRGTPWV